MANRQLFSLDGRLALCAELVRDNAKIADIGTDHAYLPVWLAKKGRISHAIAADLRPEPLKSGNGNIKKYGVSDLVETRLSDGLHEIQPDEADDIIIAGMGGELTAKIINEATWLKNPEKRLILQPMTKSETLIKYLCENGFEIITERAAKSGGKVYSVMQCGYTGKAVPFDDVYLHVGKMPYDNSAEADEYINGKIKMLKCKADGLSMAGKTDTAAEIYALADRINKLCERRHNRERGNEREDT